MKGSARQERAETITMRRRQQIRDEGVHVTGDQERVTARKVARRPELKYLPLNKDGLMNRCLP